MGTGAITLIVVAALLVLLALAAVRIVREHERVVVFRLGRLRAARGPGQAAHVIGRERGALTLRTLQTLAEVATEHNPTIVLPIPIDVLDRVAESDASEHAAVTAVANGGHRSVQGATP